MINIQPLLVPCRGALADLLVTPDPSDTEKLHVYWGTALLQVLPRDKTSPLFRIVVGLLLCLKFRIGAVSRVFGVSEKTLRVWRDGLLNGEWHDIAGSFHGPGASTKLRRDVITYILKKYRKACRQNKGKMPYGFVGPLVEDVKSIWPDQEVSEETLRKLFRKDDDIAKTSDVGKNERNESFDNDDGAQPFTPEVSTSDSPKRILSGNVIDDCSALGWEQTSKPKYSPDFTSDPSSNQPENREEACDSPAAASHHVEERRTEETASANVAEGRRPPALEQDRDSYALPAERQSVSNQNFSITEKNAIDQYCQMRASIEKDGPGIGCSDTHDIKSVSHVCGNGQITGAPIDDKHNNSPEFNGSSAKGREQHCDWCPSSITSNLDLKEDIGHTDIVSRQKPNAKYFPIFSDKPEKQVFLSQHAGFLILSVWFDQAFGQMPAILRQTAAQILCGAVNQEQSKLLDYDGLEQLIGPMLRSGNQQRTRLDVCAKQPNAVLNVYQGNSNLIELPVHHDSIIVLHCDSHHEPYTGKVKMILNWSGYKKRMEKGLALDFAHSENGQPFFVGHYDNFDDARTRFFLMRIQVHRILGCNLAILWVFDRGYWGIDFLKDVESCGDYFLQWQKGYTDGGWDLAFDKEDSFDLKRKYNTPSNSIVRRRIFFRQHQWKKEDFRFGTRLIVRTGSADEPVSELAIVSNAPMMEPQSLIKFMFNRFGAQETDFSYQNRYFGINQLSERKFVSYQDIAHEVTDRQVESRAYKTARNQRQALTEELKQTLFELQGVPKTSLQKLAAKKEKIRQRVVMVREQLDQLDVDEVIPTDKEMGAIRSTIHRLKDLLQHNDRQCEQVRQRHQMQVRRGELQKQIKQLNDQLLTISKTESRLLIVLEEKYMRPKLLRKPLLDAIRISSRNTFCEALSVFRPYYHNLRDDHKVLRALSQSAGVVIVTDNHVDVYLMPRLERQSHHWKQINCFLADCEKRIYEHWHIKIRFITKATSSQILYAANRAKSGIDDTTQTSTE